MERGAARVPLRRLVFMRGLCVIAVVSGLCAAAVPPQEAVLLREATAHREDFAASRRLAEYYLSRQQVSSALPWLENAARIDSADYNNSYDLALARLETKNFDGAERLVRQMLSRQDRSEPAFEILDAGRLGTAYA